MNLQAMAKENLKDGQADQIQEQGTQNKIAQIFRQLLQAHQITVK
jgi:hypothetical protein